MPYDLHIVRTRDWTEAASAPVTKQDVDALIAADTELSWSTTDYVDMSDEAGVSTRYFNWSPEFLQRLIGSTLDYRTGVTG